MSSDQPFVTDDTEVQTTTRDARIGGSVTITRYPEWVS